MTNQEPPERHCERRDDESENMTRQQDLLMLRSRSGNPP